MTTRNTYPADHIDVLKRLLNCNWQDLAAHLEISPNTLKRWRDTGAGADGSRRISDLFQKILRESEAEWMQLPINWSAIHTIGGKR